MNQRVRFDDVCKVTQANSGKEVDADILNFNEGRNLTVSINKSVKLMMTWNGRLYEGRMAGMDFTSPGPKAQRFTEGR